MPGNFHRVALAHSALDHHREGGPAQIVKDRRGDLRRFAGCFPGLLKITHRFPVALKKKRASWIRPRDRHIDCRAHVAQDREEARAPVLRRRSRTFDAAVLQVDVLDPYARDLTLSRARVIGDDQSEPRIGRQQSTQRGVLLVGEYSTAW